MERQVLVFLKLFLKISFRGGFLKPESLLPILSVAIGSSVLFITLGFLNSYIHTAEVKMKSFSGSLNLKPYAKFMDESLLQSKLEGTQGVDQAIPYVITKVVLATKESMRGALLEATQSSFVSDHMKPRVLEGSSLMSSGGLFLGAALAEELKVHVGDEVRLLFFQDDASSTQSVSLKVGGILDYGQHAQNKRYVLMDLENFRNNFNFGSKVSGVKIITSEKVEDFLALNSLDGFFVQTWKDQAGPLFQAVQYEKTVLIMLLFILILVAAFNLAISLFVSTLKKTPQISLLRALGASYIFLFLLFSLRGLILGSVGLLIGLGLTYWGLPFIIQLQEFFELLPQDVYNLSGLIIKQDLAEMLQLSVLILIACWISAILPTVKALRQNLSRGLSFE